MYIANFIIYFCRNNLVTLLLISNKVCRYFEVQYFASLLIIGVCVFAGITTRVACIIKSSMFGTLSRKTT